MKESRLSNGCALLCIPILLVPLIAVVCGIYHAFCESAILGILAIILCESVTPIVEIIDWFSSKDVWHEIAVFLGLN